MKSKFLLLKDEIKEEMDNLKELRKDFSEIKNKNFNLKIKKRLFASLISDKDIEQFHRSKNHFCLLFLFILFS